MMEKGWNLVKRGEYWNTGMMENQESENQNDAEAVRN